MTRPKIYRTVDILCYIVICVNVSVGILALFLALKNQNQPKYLDYVFISFKLDIALTVLLVPLMMFNVYDFTYTLTHKDSEKK